MSDTAVIEPKEAITLIQFLNRVDLKGSEAETLAYLKSKLNAIREGRPFPSQQLKPVPNDESA